MTKYNVGGRGIEPLLTELEGFQPESILNAAIRYKRMGLHAISLNGKQPILPDWPNRELAEEELPSHFTNDRNIGLVLGGSTGLVNIDLDNPVAMDAADYLLPSTL